MKEGLIDVRHYHRQFLHPPRKCERCYNEFQPYKSNHKYCSATCRLGRWKDPDYQKKWYQQNKVKHRQSSRRAQLKRDYGISWEEFEQLQRTQEFKCLICQTIPDRLVVDHCHSAGHVRGLLCDGCNTGLGMFKDNPTILQSAINYLQEKSH